MDIIECVLIDGCIYKKGDLVLLVTDNTDFEPEIVDKIEFINKDVVELKSTPIIRWEYVKSIDLQPEF